MMQLRSAGLLAATTIAIWHCMSTAWDRNRGGSDGTMGVMVFLLAAANGFSTTSTW